MKIFKIFFFFFSISLFAQVGIGTINPDASAMLDISSTTKGFLAPRMTSAQISAISSPANGLMVFDTTLSKFTYFNGSGWNTVEPSADRSNYVLVKSVSDLPTPVGNTITLSNGVLYEINGAINLGNNTINLNGCTVLGGDASSDKLIYTGTGSMITSTNGGLIEFLQLIGNVGGSQLFSVSDSGLTKNFILRDCYIMNFSSLGSVSGHRFLFFDSLNMFSNGTGITFSDSNQLYVHNYIWETDNTGTAISLSGSFNSISISGGKIIANAGETGFNVGTTTIVDDAVLNNMSFTGDGTRVTGTFTKLWEIESAGIMTQKDDAATGSIYISSTSITTIPAINTPVKVNGTTTSANLFRVDTNGQNNRLRYMGTKTRYFNLIATFSLVGGRNDVYAFYIYKNGVKVPSIYVENKIAASGDVGAASIMGTVELAPTDYVELWVENQSAAANCTINAMNFIIQYLNILIYENVKTILVVVFN